MTRAECRATLKRLCMTRGALTLSIEWVRGRERITAWWLLPNPRSLEEEYFDGVGSTEDAACSALVADVRARIGYTEERGGYGGPGPSMLARRSS